MITLGMWFFLQLFLIFFSHTTQAGMTYQVKDFIRVSTALCLRHILVSAVPISLVAPLAFVAASAIFWKASRYAETASIAALKQIQK